MTDREHIRADFERMVKRTDQALELARAALLVAAEADPRMDVDAQVHTLGSWAAELRARIEPGWNNLQKLARLRRYVFEDLGFRGEHEDYYSPSNSLLHEVMQRRRGIPLTLGILFMELGWSIGMPLEGVGFPGHFLVRLSGEPADLLLDPFSEGRSLSREDARGLLDKVTGGHLEFDEELLASITKRDMIVRLLLNLKGAYLRENRDEEALAAVDRLLLLRPDEPAEVRDRGLLLYRLRRFGAAYEALRRYRRAAPDAPDGDRVDAHLEELRRILADLN